MDRKTLPAREKQIREDEWHLFCPGEGCSARLGIRQGLMVTLEPCYTNAPHPGYPADTWWKQERPKGPPRARDARKAMRDVEEATEGVSPEDTRQVVKETVRQGKLLDLAVGPDYEEDATPEDWHEDVVRRGEFGRVSYILGSDQRYFRLRVVLPPGTHTVVCGNYRCGGLANIKAPIPDRTLPPS